MEAIVEHQAGQISATQVRREVSTDLDEARAKVDAYLRAWKLPEAARRELLDMAMMCAEARPENQGDAARVAIEEAERLLRGKLNEMLGNALTGAGDGVTEQERLAMLWAGLPDRWRDPSADTAALSRDYAKGALAATLAQQPQRPPQTHPTVMQTSLSRLPSFRMVAGWGLLIVLIVLAFIFTR